MARYAQRFKDRAVARLLPPESAPVELVSRELQVGIATLERWRSEALSLPQTEPPCVTVVVASIDLIMGAR